MKQQRINLKTVFGAVLLIFALFFVLPINVHAEGSRDLTNNTGYRPFIERYSDDHTTAGERRCQFFYLQVKEGETVCLGSSVQGATGYTDDAEIRIQNGEGDVYLQVTAEEGFIANHDAELAGPAYGKYETKADAYTPVVVPVTEANYGTGVWRIDFYSKQNGNTNNNPRATLVDADFISQQGAQLVGAWDATVFDANGEMITGRLFADELFLNTGPNDSYRNTLMSKVYTYTKDQFIYEIDFNGLDPYGFLFYTNNRGLLYSALESDNPNPKENEKERLAGAYSLYHSVLTEAQQNLKGLEGEHNIWINAIPSTNLDSSNHVFFNEPDLEFFPIGSSDITGGANDIKNFRFEGTVAGNASLEGDGGTFVFEIDTRATNATSYQIRLEFGDEPFDETTGTNGRTVLLSNVLVDGENRITWDGRDGTGAIVGPNTYTTAFFAFKRGEMHVPLIDVESNKNGLKIYRQALVNNTLQSVETKVYYNNHMDDKARFEWDGVAWEWIAATATAPEPNYTFKPVTLDPSTNKSFMPFQRANMIVDGKTVVNPKTTGDDAAIDIWTYEEIPITVSTHFVILEKPKVTFTGTKTWTKEGDPAFTAPTFDVPLTFSVVDDATQEVVSTGSVAKSGDITFTPIEYGDDVFKMQAGDTYVATYTVKENLPEPLTFYSTENEFTATVTFTSKGVGVQPDVTWVYADKNGDPVDNMDFVNTYKAAPVEHSITAQKVIKDLKGADIPIVNNANYQLNENDFTFELYEGEITPSPDKLISTTGNGTDGSIIFTPIKYTAPGTYTYTLRERTGTDTRFKYDEVLRTVTVTVVDNNGALEVTSTTCKEGTGEPAEVTTENPIIFTNIDQFDMAELQKLRVDVSKTLTVENSMLPTLDAYKFQIEKAVYYAPGDLDHTYTSGPEYESMPIPADTDIEISGMGQKAYLGDFIDDRITKTGSFAELDFVITGEDGTTTNMAEGIYVYKVTEITDAAAEAVATAAGVTLDDKPCFIYVYVTEDERTGKTYASDIFSVKATTADAQPVNPQIPETGAPYAAGESDDSGNTEAPSVESPANTVSAEFTNVSTTRTLTITNKVKGDYAQTTRPFKYGITITLSDTVATAVSFPVTVAGSNITTCTIKAGDNEFVLDPLHPFEIKHGESIIISGLPYNATVTITERNWDETDNTLLDADMPKGYLPTAIGTADHYTVAGDGSGTLDSDGVITGAMNKHLAVVATTEYVATDAATLTNVQIDFTNRRVYIPTTGLILYYAPYVLPAVIVVIAGISFFIVWRRKKKVNPGEGF